MCFLFCVGLIPRRTLFLAWEFLGLSIFPLTFLAFSPLWSLARNYMEPENSSVDPGLTRSCNSYSHQRLVAEAIWLCVPKTCWGEHSTKDHMTRTEHFLTEYSQNLFIFKHIHTHIKDTYINVCTYILILTIRYIIIYSINICSHT